MTPARVFGSTVLLGDTRRELGDLALVMHTIRLKLQGHEYMQACVLALTHEL